MYLCIYIIKKLRHSQFFLSLFEKLLPALYIQFVRPPAAPSIPTAALHLAPLSSLHEQKKKEEEDFQPCKHRKPRFYPQWMAVCRINIKYSYADLHFLCRFIYFFSF